MFAECILSDTRQINFLPSAALKTLGTKKHSVNRRFAECKKNTRQRGSLPSVFFFALGKEIKPFFLGKEKKKMKKKLCQVSRSRTLGKEKNLLN